MLIDTSTVLSVTWFGLGAQRRMLPAIFYAGILAADPSIALVYSSADVEAHSETFSGWVDRLASGMLTRDMLTGLGTTLVRNGFTRHQVEQFSDVFLESLKTVYGPLWTLRIEDAWTRLVAKASYFIQGADRRRNSG